MGADSPRLRKFLQAALGEEALSALELGLAREPKLAKAMPQRAVLSWALKACQYSYDGPVPGQDDLWLSLSKSGATLVCDQERVELGSDLYKITAALALTLELEPEPQQLATKAAQRLGKSLDQLVGTRMVRVELELEDQLRKALSLIPPGKPSGLQSHDYSHVLDPKNTSAGYSLQVHHDPRSGLMRAKVYHRGQDIGGVSGSVGGEDMEIDDSQINDAHRNRGLGLSAYEGLMAHGFHQGAKRVVGGVHSSMAGRVHASLVRKHGLGYEQTPTPYPHLADPTPSDAQLGPYSYHLKSEPVAKAWPRDEHENQANAATHQVLEDQMLEHGAEKRVDPGVNIQGENFPATSIPLPKNLKQKASQNRTWKAAAANRNAAGTGAPHSGNYNIPGPNEIGPPGGLPDNTANMGGWNIGGPGLADHDKWKGEQTRAADRTFWRRLDVSSHHDAFPIPELTQGKTTYRFDHGYDTSTSTGGVPDEPRRQVMVTMRDAFHEGGEKAPHSTVGMWNPHTGAWTRAPHPDYADLHAELGPHLQSWFQANPMAKAELEKKTAPNFPKLGFADDRRETVIADTPRQKQMASRVQAQSIRNLAKDPQQAQHLGVDLQGVDTQEIDQHFKERGFSGKGALGSVAAGPNPGPHAIGPNMRRATYQSLNPGLQDENESLNDPNSVRPVQLHENLHGLFNRVATKHGGDARNALTQNLWGWVSYRAPKAAHAVQEALKRFYNFDGQSGKAPFEEFLATTLNLANSKSDRADLNFRLGLDEKQGRQLHQAFNTVHRHMAEGGKMADDRWLSPHGFKQFLMGHVRTSAPEQQSRPDQQEALDFMVGMSPRERAQTVQAMQPPKKHFLDDMPMRKAEGWEGVKAKYAPIPDPHRHHWPEGSTQAVAWKARDRVAAGQSPHERCGCTDCASWRSVEAHLAKGWPRSEAENEANRQGFVRESPPTEDAIMEQGLDRKQVHGVSPGHNPVHDVTNLSSIKDIDRRSVKRRELEQTGLSYVDAHDQAFRDMVLPPPGLYTTNQNQTNRQTRKEHPELDFYERNVSHGAAFSTDRGAGQTEDREIEAERQRMRRGSMDPPSYFRQKEDSFWHLLGTAADFHAKKPTAHVANSRARVQVQKLPDEIFSRMHSIKKGWPRSEKQNQENKAGFIRESPPTEDRLMEQGLSTKTQHGVMTSTFGDARFPSGKPAAWTAYGQAPEAGEPMPMFDFGGTGNHDVGAYQRRTRNTSEVADRNRAINDRQYTAMGRPEAAGPASQHGSVYDSRRGANTEEDDTILRGNGINYVEDQGLAMRRDRLNDRENSFWRLLSHGSDLASKKARVPNGRASVKVQKLPKDIATKMNKAWPKPIPPADKGGTASGRDPQAAATHQVLNDSLLERGAQEISPQDATQKARNAALKVIDEYTMDSRRGRRADEARNANQVQDFRTRRTAGAAVPEDGGPPEPNARRSPISPFTPKPAAWVGGDDDNYEQDLEADRGFWHRLGQSAGLKKGWPKNDQENQANAAAGAVAEDQLLDQGAKREEFGPDRDLLWEGLNQDIWEGGTHGDVQTGGRKMFQVGSYGRTKPSDESAMNRHAVVAAANENDNYGYPGRGGLPYGDIGAGPNPTATGNGSGFFNRVDGQLTHGSTVYFPASETTEGDAPHDRDNMVRGHVYPELEAPMQGAVQRADQVLAPPPTPKAEGIPAPDPKAWAKLKSKLGKKLGKKVRKVELPGQTHQPEKQVGPLEPQAPQFQPQNGIQLQAQRKKPTPG